MSTTRKLDGELELYEGKVELKGRRQKDEPTLYYIGRLQFTALLAQATATECSTRSS